MGVRLPSAYQEVEWIQRDRKLSGGAYILTDYVPVNGDSIDATIMLTDSRTQCIFSAGAGTYQLIALFDNPSADQTIWCKYFQTGGAPKMMPTNFMNTWQHLTVSGIGLFQFAGESVQCDYTAPLDGAYTELMFFSRRRTASDVGFLGKIKEVVVANNDQNKLHLIPCYRKLDSKPGMYDLVSGEFLVNQGTGEFLVGPDVIDSISPLMVAWRRGLMHNVSRYIYEASNLSFNGKSDCINTGVYLFTQENIDRDFEFIAEGIVGNGNIHSGESTIICAKYDTGALGFLVRPTGSTSLNYNGTIFVKRDTDSTVIIRRINGVITLSGTNITNPTIQFTNAVFNHPLVFGCALQDDGTPYRYCQGTIAHVTVRWL